ncbi:MAG: hypothetical protein JO079_01415 [Frankiaceae bacterium]|nr:hypothetical protein [Frankiaceae bacterium]MBV9369232.1 hypothetical protein [Frankiales bacterium]
MSALNLHGVTGLASAADGSLRITVSPNGDTPWLYDVSSAGTVTKAQRTSNAVPAVDPSGDTLVGAGYGMVRMFPDGSEEQLTSYDNVEQWAHPPVMGVGGDGAVWWARDSYPGMAGERLWKLSEPAASARPAAITGVAFHWDGNGPYVSWHAPAVGEQVIPVLRHGANAVAANPFDGFDLTYYTHSAIANTASVVFGEATDPIVQGEPFTVTLFPETVDGTVIGPPTVATYLLVPPTTCAIKPSVRTVPYGKSVAVTGTLTSLGSALAGEAATLSAQAVGKPSVVLKSTLTSSTGTVAASQVPVANTTYTFQHAVDNYAACAGSVVVTVAPTVTAVLAAATIHRGAHTTLTTTVGPNLSGQYVTLQHLVGTSWRTVSSLKLNRYSKAAWTVGSTTAGTFRYRVIKTADKYHAASISAVATLKVT